jgi:Kef-type K+ transport system membrane component KefB
MAGASSDFVIPLLEISLIIFIAEVIRTSLSRFNLPGLVGEVFAGILISPYAIGGFVNSLLGFELFSINQYLLFLSEFSVILLVFASGLDHGVAPLRKAGIYGYLGAIFGALLPAFTAFYFYSNSFGFNSSLILGTALGATSLAAVSSIIYSQRLHGKGVDFLMTAAAVDDVVDLVLLSVVLGIISTSTLSIISVLNTISYYTISWIIIFITSIYLIPKIANKIKDWLIEEFMFLVIFGLVVVMVSLGFSPVIAAFIAGVALAESIKKEKVMHISEVLLAIFGSLFFVSIGMQLNILELNFNTFLLALELTGIAFLFKIVGVLPFALLYLKKVKASVAVSIAMTPRGEIGLVIASIGGALGILNQEELIAIVFMAVLTTLIGASVFNKVAKWLMV